jgi:hypothetical protein
MTEDELREIQARLYLRQSRWETPKALAMILLAVAALAATSHLIDWLRGPLPPQTIIIRMEKP